MIRKAQRCKSQSLFQYKNRQSLSKLQSRNIETKALPLVSTMKPSSIKAIILEQKERHENKKKQEERLKLRIHSSQSNSNNKIKLNDRSLSAQKIQSPLRSEKSKSKLNFRPEKPLQRPATRQHTGQFKRNQQAKNKSNLKIQRIEDFRSIIPQSGFIEGTEKLEMNYKSRPITISKQGILQRSSIGWQFKTIQDYELYIKKVNKLVNLEFFKHFYKVRIFNKWKKLSRYVKKQNIIKFLSHSLVFNTNNIYLVLKQQEILTRLASKHFLLNIDHSRDSMQQEEYNDYLFASIVERLKELKCKAFEEFYMELIINLRKIIHDHEVLDKQQANFKLSDLAFEDYFIRKNIQDHEIILLKFIYRYQQVKIDIIFRLLQEILNKIKYNIQKWNSNFNKDFTLFDAINSEFSQARSDQIDYSCFSHETKIKQIIIHIKANEEVLMDDFRFISQNFVLNFIEQAKRFLREKYESGFHCDSELAQLNKNLLWKKIISERQYMILDKCLKKIDTYCFAEYFKRVNQDVNAQILKIGEIVKQNLATVINATKLIQSNFLNIINELINTQVNYKFEYCSYIEKLTKKVSRIPLRLKMGMYCLDLKATTQFYETTIKANYSIIVKECLKIFQDKISAIDIQILSYDENIKISSWSIKEFISSFKHSNDYNFYFENTLRDNFKELDSILMTIHRVQPRYYEQSYLVLFHCKQRSQIVRSKSLCFLREITHKLNYLIAEKDKRVVKISQEIDQIQQRMVQLVTAQSIEFNYAFEMMNVINEQLQIQGKEIEELSTFIEIQKTYLQKESKQVQFLAFDKLKSEVSFLLKLLNSYKEFEDFMHRQLDRQYTSFRLQLLVDCIHNEIAKIKQSIRFLHNYEKFLVNISAFYQADNTKIRLLRVIMQLEIDDLVKLDKKNFVMYERYTAKHMLQYIKSQDKNQNNIKLFLEEKEYTNRVKDKIVAIQTKITKFLLIGSSQNFDETIHPDLNNFVQMLQRNESQLEDYVKNQHLKELRSQIYDFLSLLRKSIRFLAEYVNIFELYTLYQSYLKKPNNEERVINKFLNLFKEQSRELTEICEKWWQLNIGIREINLKSIIDHKYEHQIERIYTLQTLIRVEMNKINQYLNKRIQQFPLLSLLPTELLVNVVNQPLLFLQYIHSTVKEVYWEHSDYLQDSHKNSIIIKTIYDQKIVIPVQRSENVKKYKQSYQKQQNIEKHLYKVELQSCMSQITSMIKNNIVNLLNNSFQYYRELISTQKIPLQVIFASDQINNYSLLITNKNQNEVISRMDREIQMLINDRQKDEFSKYEMLLIDILLLSKLEFKNKIDQNSESQIYEFISFQKKDDDIYLEVYNDSIKLDYQLVDANQFTIIEPINYRTFIKLYQSIIQMKSSFLFEPFGLHNLAARLMRHIFVIADDKDISFETAVSLSSKQSVIFYFKSQPMETESQFFQKISSAFSVINNALFDKERKLKSRLGSMKNLSYQKPSIYIQIPLSLYQSKQNGMNHFETYYKQLTIQQRFTFRVIEFYQPSLCLLLKICLLHENLLLEGDAQSKILEEFLIYRTNQNQKNLALNHRDVLLIMKNIAKSLALFEKVETETIKIAFKILTNEISIDDIDQKIQRKKTVIFRNRSLNGKNNQSILKWEETKLNQQFIKFSKKMDEILEEEDYLMIVGKPCTGKSYMIKLYYEMVNSQIRNEKERGRVGGSRLMKFEGVDLSLIQFDPNYVNSQIKIICKDSKQSTSEYLWLIWFDGIEKLDNKTIQDILHKNRLINLNHIDYKVLIELSNMDHLSPRVALSYKHIVVSEKSFSVLQIIHTNKQQIMYLLSDSILHKIIDPFTIFYKIIKDFFAIIRKLTQKIFVIPYEQQLITIHTFQLLIGIIKHKSPKLVQHFETLKENDKMQSLRKLFAFCFLWVTSSLVEDNISKKFEESFLDVCKKEQIDIQGIGSNYIINHKSDLIQYIPLKNAKNSLLKVDEPIIINNSNVFIQTYQTIILNNLLLFVTSNSVSKIILFGENQTGKTAILHHFVTNASKNYRHFYYICSLYTYNCLRDLNKSLKEMNSVYEREKVEQMLKEEKSKQVKWYMNLAKSKCVFVENIAMDLWKPTLSYFKYITSLQRIYVDGEICDFRNLHLLLQRNLGYPRIPEQKYFLHVKLNYDQGYFSEVFYGIYQIIGKAGSQNHDACYQIMKIKGAIVKNMLLLMKMINKKISHSVKYWNYFYPLSTLKHILQELKNKVFRSKGEFLQGLFQEIEFELYRRMKDETSKVIFYRLLENCRQHIKEDLREDFILEEPSYLRAKEEEIILKLTNYLEYKNQFKNLKKSKTLISNLTQFYEALNKKPLIILNCSSIPGVGSFLPVAVEILGLQLIEISNLQQFKLMTSESERQAFNNKSQDITLYYIPSWVVSNQELLASLSNKIRNLEYTVRVKRNKRLSQILGTTANQNKCFYIIEYSDKIERKELNILRYNELMKSATFLQLETPVRNEMLQELNEFLGKEREELNSRLNEAIINKIKRIYEIFQNEQSLKKMNISVYEYLFSIENYFRFIKIIIDTYFERKYEIKSSLSQLELSIIKLEELVQEYKNIKAKNTELKGMFNQSRKKISAMNESYNCMSEYLLELTSNQKYLSLKDKKLKIIEHEKIKQKMLHQEHNLLETIENFKAIPRMEIANLKSLYNNNNQSFGKPLFESLSLLISDSEDAATIKKTISDINLNLRIRQINFKEKREEVIRLIEQKLNLNAFELEEYKVCYNLINWLKYSIEYFNFRQDFNENMEMIAKVHLEAFENREAAEVQASIQKINVEIDEIKEKLEKEKNSFKQLDAQLKQSDLSLKNIAKFSEIQHFKDECEKEKEVLLQEYKLCLESSIYFSIKLNFIFPCELYAGTGIEIIKGKQKFDSYRALMEKLFVRWCCETIKEIDLGFFRHQIHKIFENKQKYEFIDKQLQSQDGNRVIAKCKKIGNINIFVDHYSKENKDIDTFVPHITYNKLIYLKYILSIRYCSNNILLIDPYGNIYKYLVINFTNKITLKRNSPKHDANKHQDTQPVTAYLLKQHESPILDTNYNILFVELPTSAQQILFTENRRDMNGIGYCLKINFSEYLVPYFQNLKIVYTCRKMLNDPDVMHQFYCIHFSQNSLDALELINSQILKYHLNKMSGNCGLFNCMKQSTNVVLNEFQIKRLVTAMKKERLNHYLQKKEKELKFQIIERFTSQCNQKFSIANTFFMHKILGMIDEWRAANKEWKDSIVNLNAIKSYCAKFINPYTENLLQIYRVYFNTNEKVWSGRERGERDKNHESFTYFVKIIRQGIKYLHLTEHFSTIEKQLILLEKFVLNSLCNYSLNRDAYTLALFLKIFSLKNEVANNFELLNLFSVFSYENFLESLIESRVDSYAHAAHLEVPVYKLEIEKLLKSIKDIRSDKADPASRLKNKNFILSPEHINELISNFEFKNVKKDLQEGEAESFRKLPLFTRLLLQKWLTPQIFLKSCWEEASAWKEKHVTLELKHHSLSDVCFFYCDIKYWCLWLESCSFPNVEIIKIYDSSSHLEEIAKRGDRSKLLILVELRESMGEEKNEPIIRQRLQEYLSMNFGNLIILINDKFHPIFHEVFRLIHKSLEFDEIRAQCLEIYQFFELLQKFQEPPFKHILNHRTSIAIQGPDPSRRSLVCESKETQLLTKWNIMKGKVINNYRLEIERITIGPILNEIERQLFSEQKLSKKFLKLANAKLTIWERYRYYDVDNFTSNLDELELQFRTPEESLLSGHVLPSAEEEPRNYRKAAALMSNLAKNRMAINGYLRNKVAARFKENNTPIAVAKTKYKTNTMNILEEIEFRYAFADPDSREGLPCDDDFRSSTKRISRMRNIKSRNSTNLQKTQEEYQVESFIHSKSRKLVASIEAAIDELLGLWKVHEGEKLLIIDQHQLRRIWSASSPFEEYFIRRYEEIIAKVLENEQLLAIKEYRRMEILLSEENVRIFLHETKDSNILHLNYHYALRKDYEVVLKCYDIDRCQDCLFLGRRKGSERICLLIRNILYEISYNSQLLIKDYQIPYINIRMGFEVIQAKIYCKKIIAELL